MNNFPRKFLFLLIFTLLSDSALAEKLCTFSSYQWNTQQRKAVGFKRHQILYSELNDSQRDALTGCTLCQEDQVTLEYPGLPSFKVCHVLAATLRAELDKLFKAKVSITSIEAYRVGKTKGPIDEQGNRTQYSNHSFGVAIDFNADFNGLYTNCIEFNDNCRLIKGGPWHPRQKESLHPSHPIVLAMRSIGLKWGGEILGKQKDFMHFSPSGY